MVTVFGHTLKKNAPQLLFRARLLQFQQQVLGFIPMLLALSSQGGVPQIQLLLAGGIPLRC